MTKEERRQLIKLDERIETQGIGGLFVLFERDLRFLRELLTREIMGRKLVDQTLRNLVRALDRAWSIDAQKKNTGAPGALSNGPKRALAERGTRDENRRDEALRPRETRRGGELRHPLSPARQ
jgi:hypothetical protein